MWIWRIVVRVCRRSWIFGRMCLRRRCGRCGGGMSGVWWRWIVVGSRSMILRWYRCWRSCGVSMMSKCGFISWSWSRFIRLSWIVLS